MSKFIKIAIGIVVVLVIFFVVSKIIKSDEKTDNRQVATRVDYSDTENLAVSGEAAALLRTLNNLEKVELNGDIFFDPAFRDLVDYSKVINPIQKYRQNPFSPIGSPNSIRRNTFEVGAGTDAPQNSGQATSTGA